MGSPRKLEAKIATMKARSAVVGALFGVIFLALAGA
jgi:hypothetical protein